MKNIRKEQGFTLIELLIVVAIIAIIAAIAVPNLMNARRAANETSAISALRSVGQAQMNWSMENPGFTSLATLVSAGVLDSRFATGNTINGYGISVAPVNTDINGRNGQFGSEPGYQAIASDRSLGRYDFSMHTDFVVRYQTYAPTGKASGDPVGS